VRQLFTGGMLAVLALLALPAGALAQQAGQQQPPAEVQQWIAQMQEIQGRLGAAFEQAMENQALRQEQAEIAQAMDAAMRSEHPTLEQDMARANQIQAEAAAAHQAGDEATLERLTREFEAIDARLGAAQQRALERNGLGERMESFQTRLIEQMLQHEPATTRLIQQREELEVRITTAMRGVSQP
jgi:hypothetical protein